VAEIVPAVEAFLARANANDLTLVVYLNDRLADIMETVIVMHVKGPYERKSPARTVVNGA
jgi:hypothetical protein